jgi:Tol biopolymer transport system component
MNRKAGSKWWLVTVTVFLAGTGGQANAEFVFGPPTKLGPTVNTGYHDAIASMSADGLTLWMDSNRSGGYGQFDIWTATRPSLSDPWDTPMNPGSPINTGSWDGAPSISADDLTLYFTSDRSGGQGGADTWVTTRETVGGPWGSPVNLGPTVNSSAFDVVTSITADGLSLFFGSGRSGGSGNVDIWVTTRATTDDDWGAPVNLGPTVNSPSDDTPTISADGRTLFLTSERSGGYGGRDIWITKRANVNDPWSEPVNLGLPINSSAWDQQPILSPNGSTLYFNSLRAGGSGLDIYQVSISPIVDFNGDGEVDGGEVRIMASHLGENHPSCDIGPTPLGDGVVDANDLLVLADHIGKEVTDSTLMAHWALDETEGTLAFDSIGENDGSVIGGATWRPDGGQLDGALELDGVDDSVVTDFVVNPVDGPFSVSVWVKGGAPGQVLVAQADGTKPGAAWISADPSGGKLMTNLMFPLPPLVSDVVITDGRWHRVVLTWDGQRRQLYVDETSAASDLADLPATIPSDGGLRFGADKNARPGSFFAGLIDDLRIYNRAVKP